MAEEVGADPTSPVLETGAFAAMLLLNMENAVCPCCQASFRFARTSHTENTPQGIGGKGGN